MKRFILAVSIVVAMAATYLPQAQQGRLAGLIQAGNARAALEMIRSGADVNEPQPDGTTPLHWAVYRVDYELLQALIERKAKADVRNELGSTPLVEAVKLSDPRMVKMLLDAGSGPEGANEDGQTALMVAIKNGDLPIVQQLLDAGANVNAVEKVQDQTPLMWAAAATRNAPEMVKLLIAKGADVSARAMFHDWPSQITSEPRAQYHAYGGLTVLLYAARGGCLGCVEALVAAGADVNLPTLEGVTPLMVALDNSHNNVAKFLLDNGANPHVWDVYGRTALYIAVDKKAAGGGGAGGRGAAPGAGGGRGGAAGAGGRGAGAPGGGGRGGGLAGLGVAAGPTVSSMDIINALLAAGVDVNPQLSMRRPSNQGGRFSDPLLSTGTTPLLRAMVNNDTEVARVLLEKGANPNIFGMGTTPFLVAAGGGPASMPLLDLFIEKGADVNAQITGTKTYSMRIARSNSNNEGMSALHTAVQGVAGSNQPQAVSGYVRYLLEHGADPALVDANGRTPLDLLNAAGARGGAGGGAGAAGARGGRGGAAPNPAAAAAAAAAVDEIRTLLETAAKKP